MTFTVAAFWLILPVVICLSQRLSHACLSTSLTDSYLFGATPYRLVFVSRDDLILIYWTRRLLALHLTDSYSYLEMISALQTSIRISNTVIFVWRIIGPAGHQTYRALVIGPAGQQTYRAIAILSYLFGATPYGLVWRYRLRTCIRILRWSQQYCRGWCYTLRTRICISKWSQQYRLVFVSWDVLSNTVVFVWTRRSPDLQGLSYWTRRSTNLQGHSNTVVFVWRYTVQTGDDLSNTVGVGATPYGLVFVWRYTLRALIPSLSNSVWWGGGGVALHEIFSGILSGLALQLTDLYLECSKFLAMGLIIFMNYIASCRMDHFMNLADFFAFTYM